jgi:hypothetical protein
MAKRRRRAGKSRKKHIRRAKRAKVAIKTEYAVVCGKKKMGTFRLKSKAKKAANRLRKSGCE